MLSLRGEKSATNGRGKSQCRETVREAEHLLALGQPNLFGEWCIAVLIWR